MHKKGALMKSFLSSKRGVFSIYDSLNVHTQITDHSGVGRSNIIKLISEQRVFDGSGLIILDLKENFENLSYLTGLCKKAGRLDDLKIFSASKPQLSNGYNPVSWGDAAQIHDRIMYSLNLAEGGTSKRNVKKSAQFLIAILQALVELRDIYGKEFTIKEIVNCFDRMSNLDELSRKRGLSFKARRDLEEAIKISKTLEGDQETIALRVGLKSLCYTSFDKLFTGNDALNINHRINFNKDIQSRKIIYMAIDNLMNWKESGIMGRLILQDLMDSIYLFDYEHDKKLQTHIIIDEFQSFANRNFVDFMGKAKKVNLGITIAFQATNYLNEISPSYEQKIEDNCDIKLDFNNFDQPDTSSYVKIFDNIQESTDVKTLNIKMINEDSFTNKIIDKYVTKESNNWLIRSGLYAERLDLKQISTHRPRTRGLSPSIDGKPRPL